MGQIYSPSGLCPTETVGNAILGGTLQFKPLNTDRLGSSLHSLGTVEGPPLPVPSVFHYGPPFINWSNPFPAVLTASHGSKFLKFYSLHEEIFPFLSIKLTSYQFH